jgi:hypothetical protein
MSAVHWSARALHYLETGKNVSKAEACRWARTALDPAIFEEILDIAENERYPYHVERAAPWMAGTCVSMIQVVAAHLQAD